MIKSMTGFGRCEVVSGNRKFTVEMKAVNHRYLDVNIKMPKKLNFFESAIRASMKDYVQRGKVDVFISYEDTSENNVCVKYLMRSRRAHHIMFGVLPHVIGGPSYGEPANAGIRDLQVVCGHHRQGAIHGCGSRVQLQGGCGHGVIDGGIIRHGS